MHLSTFTIAMIATAVLVVIGLVYLFLGWAGKRSGRVLLRGVGIVLGAVGLMVMGWMELAVEGVQAVIAWARNTSMTLRIEIGLIVLCLGVIAFVIGTIMNPIIGEEAKQRRTALADKRAARAGLPPKAKAAAPSDASAPKAVNAPAAGPTSAPAPALSGAEDDEIDAILRRHGIQ